MLLVRRKHAWNLDLVFGIMFDDAVVATVMERGARFFLFFDIRERESLLNSERRIEPVEAAGGMVSVLTSYKP